MSECETALYDTSCTIDSDCVYSGICGNNGKCSVQYTNIAETMVKCFVDRMVPFFKCEQPNSLLIAMKVKLGMNAFNLSPSEEIARLVPAILAIASDKAYFI